MGIVESNLIVKELLIDMLHKGKKYPFVCVYVCVQCRVKTFAAKSCERAQFG